MTEDNVNIGHPLKMKLETQSLQHLNFKNDFTIFTEPVLLLI